MDPFQFSVFVATLLVIGFTVVVRLIYDQISAVPGLKVAVAQLEDAGEFDYLTGLPSSRYLDAIALPAAMARAFAQRDSRPFAYLNVALDGLTPDSPFRDRAADEQILSESAKAIRAAIRRSRDQVFRLDRGKARFSVLLHGVDSSFAESCALEVQAALERVGVTAAISVLGTDRLSEKMTPASFKALSEALRQAATDAGSGLIWGKSASGEHFRIFPPCLPPAEPTEVLAEG